MKKVLIFFACLVVLLSLAGGGLFWYYNNTINEAADSSKDGGNSKDNSNKGDVITLVIEKGTTSKQIVDMIYNSGLIKNKYVGYAYLKLHRNINLQAGTYDLYTSMSFEEIMDYISKGNVVDNSITVTFIEGKRLLNYVSQISKEFGYSEEEILEKLSDKAYLEKLIEKYWFLTNDILNDKLYYALEGYLYPSTYKFDRNSSIETIVEKMLDATGAILDKYRDEIEKSNFTVHEYLTLASIVELEGTTWSARKGVAGVFYNRLNAKMSLGSDVTTYYAAKVEMGERDLYQKEIDDINDYNTRPAVMAGKLPIGPICSSSVSSIEAVIEPGEHDYFYFVADKTGKTYFNKTYEEHNKTIAYLKNEGLWFNY